MEEALVIYGATEPESAAFSPDLLWRTGFRAPDPFWYAEVGGRTYLLLSPLEIGRGRKEARVDEVLPLGDGVAPFLKGRGVSRVIVPESFPYGRGIALRDSFDVAVQKKSFFPDRARKRPDEIAEIVKAGEAVASALERARGFLSACAVHGKAIVAPDGDSATSEALRRVIEDSLYAAGYMASGTIVACGAEAADPHARGAGPLRAGEPIVCDVFPYSRATHYYADVTRTLFKGKPSPAMRKLYETVREAQEAGCRAVRAGADGAAIHRDVEKFFTDRGYPTSKEGDTPYGFFHGLGHGVGLEIHEEPRVSAAKPTTLETGNVVTIEPGLYYPQPRGEVPASGVRIEDTLLAEEEDARNLTPIPKDLGWAIISSS